MTAAELLSRSGRPLIMGILNITPDSFSDGGQYLTPGQALAGAQKLVADGADIIDIGAESTRPGAEPLSADAEQARLLPVLEALRGTSTVPLSVDTYHAATAAAALAAGASIINDIWGLQYADEPGAMAKTVAAHKAVVVCMHNQTGTDYPGDIIDSIKAFFRRSLSIATAAGIKPRQLVLDPGIGFGKTAAQNLTVLRRLRELTELDGTAFPLLLGVSRKSFIGKTLDLPVEARDEASGAANLWGLAHGAAIFRVHNVRAAARQLRMWQAIAAAD